MLQVTHDVIGEALKAYWEGEKKAVIAVDSNITEGEEIPVEYLFRELEDMPELEKEALKYVQGNVLDVGAGAGVHALVLQESYSVCALESSKMACEVMKLRGVKEVVNKSIQEFEGQTFDTILLLMNGLGIAGTQHGLKSLLLQLGKLMNPKGQVILDSADIIYMYEDEEGGVDINLNANYYGELEYEISFKENKVTFQWLYLGFDLLQDYAIDAGFVCEKIYDGPMNSYLAKLTFGNE